MKKSKMLIWAVGTLLSTSAMHSASLSNLNVLYIGEPQSSRGKEFTAFLGENIGRATSVARKGFDPKSADDFDVVLLDWPQSQESRLERGMSSPLGKRAEWGIPTVLLGSAGLNLAVAWEARGGSG